LRCESRFIEQKNTDKAAFFRLYEGSMMTLVFVSVMAAAVSFEIDLSKAFWGNMRNTFQKLATAASIVLGLVVLIGPARAVTYDVSGSNGVGYTLAGTIVGDATLSTITSVNLIETSSSASSITSFISYSSPVLVIDPSIYGTVFLSFAGGPTPAQLAALIPGYFQTTECGTDPICTAILTQDSFVATATAEVSATPLPAALPLFASGLAAAGLIGWRRKRKAATQSA
jgi:hypothetical protein